MTDPVFFSPCVSCFAAKQCAWGNSNLTHIQPVPEERGLFSVFAEKIKGIENWKRVDSRAVQPSGDEGKWIFNRDPCCSQFQNMNYMHMRVHLAPRPHHIYICMLVDVSKCLQRPTMSGENENKWTNAVIRPHVRIVVVLVQLCPPLTFDPAFRFVALDVSLVGMHGVGWNKGCKGRSLPCVYEVVYASVSVAFGLCFACSFAR